MSDTENAALLLRGEISRAELNGMISESDALAYIETLHKIDRALNATRTPSSKIEKGA